MADGTRKNADPKPLPSVKVTVKLAAAAPAAGTGIILATRDGG